jgi:hypothetical protein
MRCGHCGEPLPAAGFGRPRRWCGEKCAAAAAKAERELGAAVRTVTDAGLAVVAKSVVEGRS